MSITTEYFQMLILKNNIILKKSDFFQFFHIFSPPYKTIDNI